MTRAALRVEHLSVTFPAEDGGDPVTVVEDLSFTVEPGALVCIVGRSGSGKTSILRQVAGFMTPPPGCVWWDDVDVAGMDATRLADLRRTTAAYVDQEAGLVGELTCLENVLLPAIPGGRGQVRRARARAGPVLDRVGLAGHTRSRPSTMSGGERQRTVLARALTAATPAILADEPTASLDRRWADRVIDLLSQHARDGGTVLAVSHDPALEAAADRVIRLEAGSDPTTSPAGTGTGVQGPAAELG